VAPQTIPSADREAELAASAAESNDRLLRIAQPVFILLLIAELAGMLLLSRHIWSHFELSFDFSTRYQWWVGLRHGHLDRYCTILHYSCWRDHSDFIEVPLAYLSYPFSGAYPLLVIQDIFVVGIQAMVLLTSRDVIRAHREVMSTKGLGAVLALLTACLFATPYYWATVATDVHFEHCGGVFFALGFLRANLGGRRRAIVAWGLLTLLCGAEAAILLVGIGAAVAVSGWWRSRRGEGQWRSFGAAPWLGVVTALIGLTFLSLLTVIGADQGSNLVLRFGYLASSAGQAPASVGGLLLGVVTHPWRVATTLVRWRTAIWANVSTGGVVGLASMAAVPAWFMILANNLDANAGFRSQGFQNLDVFTFITVGSVVVLTQMYSAGGRRRAIAGILAVLAAVNAVGFGVALLRQTTRASARYTDAEAAALSAVARQIPADAEVVALGGIQGRFAGRRLVEQFDANPSLAKYNGVVPVYPGDVWFVIPPTGGQLAASVVQEVLGQLAAMPALQLVSDSSGVFAFEGSFSSPWTYQLPAGNEVPGWALPSNGLPVVTGPLSTWRAQSVGDAGYLVHGDYFQEMPGEYQATVSLSAQGPVWVELWDSSSNTLLARRELLQTNGMQSVVLTGDFEHAAKSHPYAGIGPWRTDPAPPPPGDALEVRVSLPDANVTASVYEVSVSPTEQP